MLIFTPNTIVPRKKYVLRFRFHFVNNILNFPRIGRHVGSFWPKAVHKAVQTADPDLGDPDPRSALTEHDRDLTFPDSKLHFILPF